MGKKKTYFSDPEKFLGAMRAWQLRGREFSDQDDLCAFYYELSEKTVAAYGRGHIDPEDLVQWCVLSCCQKSKYFDETRGTCFNFFTRVIINKIAVVYNTENNKFNPKIHSSIDDEYDEALASLTLGEESEKCLPDRTVLSVEDIFKIGDMRNADL